ncbi:hypothetical protein HA402_009037 [Bradysia odoriphaga]|nr:hypothetical protein HA402_009037 [Bradysia odoriphaga]
MSTNKIFSAPESLELENFLFNPIAVINARPTVYLIYRDEHELKDAMNKCTSLQTVDSETRKLVPKCFHLNSKDGKLFRQKYEEKAVIVTKVTTYQLKIVSSMDDLMGLLKKSPTFVDPTDQFKQRKLFADFIARFSRNYVYEIDRIIEEIQFYQVDHYSYFERSTNHLIGKVCNLFAVIMRALQIYQKQLAKMSNENSEKLLRFIELIVVGINVCIELKIFDEDDLLIKVLLDKSEEFIAFLRYTMFCESPAENQPITKPSILVLDKDTHIPTINRYGMYASQSKKAKPTKSMTVVPKLNRNGESSTNGNQHRSSQHTGKIQRMFEAQVCSGESSTCDAYEEVLKQNVKRVNDQEIVMKNYCALSESQKETQNGAENETEISPAGSLLDLSSFEFELESLSH